MFIRYQSTISSPGFPTSQSSLCWAFASYSPQHLDVLGRRLQTLLVAVAKFPSAFFPRSPDHSLDSIKTW